ncbi:MAG: AbrB/MazE/SpoVT family DNA-binding domain-containing protein [Bacteroidales bacterium]|nr:AbrB/MazE/SpoVT family DNA-binding domain-containing protein [Bacteroidales bacterium]
MEIPVIKIGNSRGIRFSKTMLNRYNIKDKVEVDFEKEQIILKPVSNPRQGWDEAFMQMRLNNDDQLIIPDIFPDENFDQWI